MVPSDPAASRRRFLKLLAASPLVSFAGLPPGLAAILRSRRVDSAQEAAVIPSIQEMLEVADFEKVAQAMMLPEHWGYLVTGVDDDSTYRANLAGFSRFQIRMRRLVDFSTLDMSTELLGVRWDTPIALCPVASLKGFHTEGESGVARAARSRGHLMMLSTVGSTGIEEVNEARGEPIWYQLYARRDWEGTLKIVKRVEAAGCPALVWTIDLLGGSNRLTYRRSQPPDGVEGEFCRHCHEGLVQPMLEGVAAPPSGAPFERTAFTWDGVKRLKDATSMKLLLKGIVTREDAELAVSHGVDGVIVSNHGGRAESSGRSTIESLPEVAAGVAGRIPVILDSGIRRGTDIFKALALGADAIGIGRPFVWGLAGFGQEGVELVLDILRRELQMVMRQCGVMSLDQMRRGRYVIDRFGQLPGSNR